ncbi:MAG TPA: LapA family protein [Roseateles sp.]|nr:LapA family protein [Roseateles sp.]
MRVFVWLFRAFIFFALFAFALNNSQEAQVRWFFGHEWRAPMVIIVLLAFGLGAALGVLAMVPAWWKHRRVAQRQTPVDAEADLSAAAPPPPNAATVRDGL